LQGKAERFRTKVLQVPVPAGKACLSTLHVDKSVHGLRITLREAVAWASSARWRKNRHPTHFVMDQSLARETRLSCMLKPRETGPDDDFLTAVHN
jgi:hypothetical protein